MANRFLYFQKMDSRFIFKVMDAQMQLVRRSERSGRSGLPTDSAGETIIKGDMIEFQRGIYSHWGIYVGDGYIIHATDVQSGNGSFSGSSSGSSSRSSSGVSRNVDRKVLKQLLTQVVDGCKFYVNNYLDKSHEPFSPDEIVQRAEAEVDTYYDYSLFTNNCEHFVTLMRYGISISNQVTDGIKTVIDVASQGPTKYAVNEILKRAIDEL